MTPYDRLYAETASARNRFLAIPLVRQAAAEGGSRALYLDFLSAGLPPREAYLSASLAGSRAHKG